MMYKNSVLASHVGVWSNTSTVALGVVGGHENGSLSFGTVKYGREPTGLGPENDCAGEDQQKL
jgi:hypothetical protein